MCNCNNSFIQKNNNYQQNNKIFINNLVHRQLYNQNNNFDKNNRPLDNEENIFKRINKIEMTKRRKSSIDTTVSCTSYNSSSYENEENEENKENDASFDLYNENISDSEEKEEKTKKCDKKEEYIVNREFENTEILRVEVKISNEKKAVFKLKRYDDVFETIKLFCEINSVDEKFIKPLIIKSLSTLNTIYQIMNSKLNIKHINILQEVQKEEIKEKKNR
jgi:hypothetical protein